MPLPIDLSDQIALGNCVMFLGDTVPNEDLYGSGLTGALLDACDGHCKFCQATGRCQEPRDCVISLTRAAQLYEHEFNRHTLVSFVKRFVDRLGAPAPLHMTLARVPIRVIVTTTYDMRLELALAQAGRPYSVVTRDTDVPFESAHELQLVKLFGSVDQPDTLILTDDDVADFLGTLNPVVKTILQGYFASRTLLFLGYDMSDPRFTVLYRQITAPILRLRRLAYAIQALDDRGSKRGFDRDIKVINIDPHKFLTELNLIVSPISARRRTGPVSREPYKFLEHFTEDDEAIFFGRSLETELLVHTILAQELTVVYGRSGIGKTSLLLAGVVPALREVGYRTIHVRTFGDPSNEIKAMVLQKPIEELTTVERERHLAYFIVQEAPRYERLVIIVDQLEEYLRSCDREQRRAFAKEISMCLQLTETNTESPLLDIRFVFSIRDDFLGELDELSDVLDRDVYANRFKLDTLTHIGASLAIIQPAEAFELPISSILVDEIVSELTEVGLEPASLQIVLYRLYSDAIEKGMWLPAMKRGQGLTLSRFEALGGARAILAGYLDAVVDEFSTPAQKEQVRAILKSMVTTESGKATVTDLEIARSIFAVRLELELHQVRETLEHLREKRVVRKFGDQSVFELTHDVMAERVWNWLTLDEHQLLDLRDILNWDLKNYHRYGHLMPRTKLELIDPVHVAPLLNEEQLDLLFRSALSARFQVGQWARAAADGGVSVIDIVSPAVLDTDYRVRAATIAALTRLGDDGLDFLERLLSDPYPRVRSTAIRGLLSIGSPRAHQILADKLVHECNVPAGGFDRGVDAQSMGQSELEWDNSEGPICGVYVEDFFIDKTPVTNADYALYLEDNPSYPAPPHWNGRTCSIGTEQHPVTQVSWHDAVAYAQWAGKRLPTEAEWEKASRGMEKSRLFPWGRKFAVDRCNTCEKGLGSTTPVALFSPLGDSTYGATDMSGNVWEWVNDWYDAEYYIQKDSLIDPLGPETGTDKVMRGGSYLYDRHRATVFARFHRKPSLRSRDFGFRCAFAHET